MVVWRTLHNYDFICTFAFQNPENEIIGYRPVFLKKKVSVLGLFCIDCGFNQIFPVLFTRIFAVSTTIDLVRIKAGECLCYGFLIRINNNDPADIVFTGKIEDGVELVFTNCDLMLVLQQAFKAGRVGFWLEKKHFLMGEREDFGF